VVRKLKNLIVLQANFFQELKANNIIENDMLNSCTWFLKDAVKAYKGGQTKTPGGEGNTLKPPSNILGEVFINH